MLSRRAGLIAAFSSFYFDFLRLELRKSGRRIRLETKPAQTLAALLEKPGELVTREELRAVLWPDDVHLDFEHSLNKSIHKLRAALSDDHEEPRYIETISRRGYRFMAAVEFSSAASSDSSASAPDLGTLAGVAQIQGPESHSINGVAPSPARDRVSPSALPPRQEPALLVSLRRYAFWAVAVSLTAILFALVSNSSTLWPVRKPALPSHQRLTYGDGLIYSARFSADGYTIVYGAAWNGEPFRLFWTREGAEESSRLNLPDADILSISHSGEMAILLNRRWRWGFQPIGSLAVVPMTGSSPRKILEDVQDADWSPDGSSLAVTHVVGSRCVLEFPIGHTLYQPNGCTSNPRVSPTGEFIAFFEHPITGNDSGSVVVINRDGKKTFWDGWSGLGGLAWEPAGRAVWFSGYRDGGQKQVYELALSGERRPIFREAANIKLHDISRDGRVLLTVDDLRSKTYLHVFGQERERDITLLDLSYATGLSSDGHTVLMNAWGDAVKQKEEEAYLFKTDEPPMRIGVGRPWDLSPDGRSVLAASPLNVSAQSSRQLVLLPIGPGQLKTLTQDAIIHSFAAWLPDGKRLVFVGHEPDHPNRSWVQSVDGGPPRAITPEGVSGWVVSPDGKTLVAKDERQIFWLYPIEDGQPSRLEGPLPEDVPARWCEDPKFLFMSTDTTRLPVHVYRLNVRTGRKELWYGLDPQDRAGFFGTGPVQVTPNGKICVNSFMSIHSVLYLTRDLR